MGEMRDAFINFRDLIMKYLEQQKWRGNKFPFKENNYAYDCTEDI
jgi:hypothetical protein